MPAGGGFIATVLVVLSSFAAGILVDALDALAGLTAAVTPGQATLVVGLLGLLFQLVKWLVDLGRARRRAGRGQPGA